MAKSKTTNVRLANHIGKKPEAISYKKKNTPKEFDLMMAGFQLLQADEGTIIHVKIDGKNIATKIIDKEES